MPVPTDKEIKSAIDSISDLIKDGLSTDNVLTVTIALMEIVNSRPIDGAEKKQFVISVLDVIIEEKVSDAKLADVLRKILPTTIDLAVSLANGVYAIGKAKCCAKCVLL